MKVEELTTFSRKNLLKVSMIIFLPLLVMAATGKISPIFSCMMILCCTEYKGTKIYEQFSNVCHNKKICKIKCIPMSSIFLTI